VLILCALGTGDPPTGLIFTSPANPPRIVCEHAPRSERRGRSDDAGSDGGRVPSSVTGAHRRSAGVVLLLAAMAIPPAGAATMFVTSAASPINGDTSSREALIANPGPDGISFL
jgi:hypothetical protein